MARRSFGWPTSAATLPGARVAIVRSATPPRHNNVTASLANAGSPSVSRFSILDLLDRRVVQLTLQRPDPATESYTDRAADPGSASGGNVEVGAPSSEWVTTSPMRWRICRPILDRIEPVTADRLTDPGLAERTGTADSAPHPAASVP